MPRLIAYFPSVFLILNGGVYFVLVFLFVRDATGLFASLGVELLSPGGLTELKSTYIGLMATLGLYSLLGAYFPSLKLGAVLVVLISYFFLALVRAWGIFIDGNEDPLMMSFLIIEIFSVVLAGLALRCLKNLRDVGSSPLQ